MDHRAVPAHGGTTDWVSEAQVRRSHAIIRKYSVSPMSLRGWSAVLCSRASPLTWRQPCEGEQAVAGFLEAVGDRAMAQPPLADEGLAALLDLLGRGRINHVGVVGGHLVVQSLGRMREQ